MNTRRMFAHVVAAAAVAAVAIAAGEPAAGSAIKVDRLAYVLDSCPFVATGGELLFDTASMAPLRPDSGFECPINQLPSSS
jgi:hypothetical protein